MKMKKVLISSLATIGLAMSLASGATYALFTAKADTSIVITAGKVAVEANAEIVKTSSLGQEQNKGEFANGGTATLLNGTVLLDRITPGDKVEINLTLKNLSNVKAVYKTTLHCIDGYPLFSGLNITIGDSTLVKGYYANGWSGLVPNSNDEVVKVTIELPEEAGNEYQDLDTTIQFSVFAAQGNAKTFTVTNDVELESALANAEDGDDIYLTEGSIYNKDIKIEKSVSIIGLGDVKSQMHGKVEISASNVTLVNTHFLQTYVDGSTGSKLVSTGQDLTLINCIVERTTTDCNAYGYVIHYDNTAGRLVLVDSDIIAPVSDTTPTPSTIAVNNASSVTAQLLMVGGSIKTNGNAFFAQHVRNALIFNVEFTGTDVNGTYQDIYSIANSTYASNLNFSYCEFANTRSNVLTLGGNFTVKNCSFINEKYNNVLFLYVNNIKDKVIIENNTFVMKTNGNLAYGIRFNSYWGTPVGYDNYDLANVLINNNVFTAGGHYAARISSIIYDDGPVNAFFANKDNLDLTNNQLNGNLIRFS